MKAGDFMKWFFKLNKFFKLVVIVLFFVFLIFSYVSYKKNAVKVAVENYLEEELGLIEEDIVELRPIISNLSGAKKWMVYVKLKDDPKGYHYYKRKGKVILESYIIDNVEHVVD